MALRTVLVYLDTEDNAARLTRFAASLPAAPDRPKVVLVGAHVTPLLPLYGGVADALTGGAAVRAAEAEHARTHGIRERFERAGEALGIATRWDELLDADRGPAATLRERARAADLVVLPQPPKGAVDRLLTIGLRDLIVHGGRPALLVPATEGLEAIGDPDGAGRHALIGWSPGREATRAAHDALELLGPGSRATLLWVSRADIDMDELERSARAMADALSRHDIDAKVVRWPHAGIPTGDVLLNEAFERGADLLVTGAWSHSRVHDALFGAVTDHLLEHQTLPVLLSH